MAENVKAVTKGQRIPSGVSLGFLVAVRKGRYTVPREEPPAMGPRRPQQRKSPARGESIAFMLLAGVVVGLGVGYVLDRLAGTAPLFIILGVFIGFAAALYAVYLETK